MSNLKSFDAVLTKFITDDFGIVDAEIIGFVKRSFFKSREHNYYKGYSCYHYNYLDKIFGRSLFLPFNGRVGLFDVLPYSYHENFTRGIKASTRLINCFNRAIDYWLPIIDESEHEAFSKSGGIASLRSDGNKSTFKSNILQAVKVNTLALKKLAKADAISEKETRIKIQAALMLDLALKKNGLPKKWIPQRYVQHKTGRLYSDGLSLQNCCREVRFSALSGCYSYDFDNCHYSLLSQLTTTKTPSIDFYLANKKEVRANLARELALPEQDVKQILISLIYGAGLPRTFNPKQAIPKICAHSEKYNKLLANSFISALHNEVKIAGGELVAKNTMQTGRHSGKVKNAMGLVSEETKESKKLSHVLQGYESAALEVVAFMTKTDTAALLHDGWITYSEHDKSAFEIAIFARLGVRLSIDFEIVKPKNGQFENSSVAVGNTDFSHFKVSNLCKLIDSNYFSSVDLFSSSLNIPSSYLSEPTSYSYLHSTLEYCNFGSSKNEKNLNFGHKLLRYEDFYRCSSRS